MKNSFLIIGDNKGRRIKTFTDCLKNKGIYNYSVMDWTEVLKDRKELEKNIKKSNIVRIEPPEKNTDIYKLFLDIGAESGEFQKDNVNNNYNENIIISPKSWFKGVEHTFLVIDKLIKENKDILSMCDLKEALVMMDKSKTYEFLEGKGKNYYLPEKMPEYRNYDEFFEENKNNFIKCFIKLRYGSGSTGVIAYSNNPKIKEEKIFTSLNYSKENGNKTFFSTYNVKSYTDKKVIRDMINWVIENGAHIEKWIPKLIHEKKGFDTRVFVLDKKSEYLLSRLSNSPITNLHLKNERKESEEFLKKNETDIIKKASEEVMSLFSKSLYSGVDIILANNLKPYVIDVNPFGDLFYNLTGTDKNVHYREIDKILCKAAESR